MKPSRAIDPADKAALAEHLSQVLADGDTASLLAALDRIVKAMGVSAVARAAGMGRESVYKVLREGNQPSFASVRAILAGIGLQLAAEQMGKRER